MHHPGALRIFRRIRRLPWHAGDTRFALAAGPLALVALVLAGIQAVIALAPVLTFLWTFSIGTAPEATGEAIATATLGDAILALLTILLRMLPAALALAAVVAGTAVRLDARLKGHAGSRASWAALGVGAAILAGGTILLAP